MGNTFDNLKKAASGEEHEWSDLYPAFAEIAKEEGFGEIAAAFNAISISEKQHDKRFKDLADNLEAGRVFERDDVVV